MATFFVIGGTGMLGGAVVDALLAAGHQVRVSVRPSRATHKLRWAEGVAAVPVAIDDVSGLARAMTGCQGVHLSLQGGPSREAFWRVEVAGAQAAAHAARQAGVQQLTLISGMGVYGLPAGREADPAYPNYPAQAKWAAEQALVSSGLPYTIFRPTNVIDTFSKFVRGSRAYLLPMAMPACHWLPAAALAERVVRSFELPEARHRIFPLLGPERLDYAQAQALYFRFAQPGVQASVMPPWLLVLMKLFSASLRTGLALIDLVKDLREVDDAETQAVFGPITESVEAYCRRLGQPAPA